MTHRLSLPFLKVTLSEIPMIAGLFDCLIPNKPIVSSAAAERALWFPQFALAIVTIHESRTRVLAIRIDRLSITLRYLIFPWSSLVNWLQRQDSLSASCLRFIYQSVMWQKPWRTVRSTKQEYLIFINYFRFITKQFDFFFAEWFEYSLEFRKKKMGLTLKFGRDYYLRIMSYINIIQISISVYLIFIYLFRHPWFIPFVWLLI